MSISRDSSLASVDTGNTRSKKRMNRLDRREAKAAFFFLLPGFIGLLLFVIIPIVASFILSFTDWQLLKSPSFIGFDNYTRLLTNDTQFWGVLGNTLFFTAEYLFLNIAISLGLAVWISSMKMGQKWFRIIFFLPTFTPTIGVSIVWMLIFAPEGLLDSVLTQLSITFPNFLLSQELAMQAVVIVSVWAGVGYNTVLFNAALDMVPETYLEAARIDGASAWYRFWKIRLPLISPTVFFGTVMTAITALQVFDQIYIMTQGGPGSATATLGYNIFQKGFQSFQMGYASAIVWVMFAMILVLTALQFWLQRKWVHYDN
ncbi:carbohydrate ABC transporter permease [Vibrio nigripulchritudo]|uniref:carbohydrate ABC transporter permease n=1 Tax=Vibrio nigripulchritudo TaxID=28173 RepID=UPI0003B2262F|nr:sugar ABC transporter permease [Vibrio nigripulchritudo]CCN68501.1 Sugar ABC transporter [Vibrio nigripulchritudo SFn118]